MSDAEALRGTATHDEKERPRRDWQEYVNEGHTRLNISQHAVPNTVWCSRLSVLRVVSQIEPFDRYFQWPDEACEEFLQHETYLGCDVTAKLEL